MSTCAGPKCNREAVAEGLCPAHYKQKQRGRPLAPIRERGNPLVALATRVSKETLEALGERPGEKAREVLTAWAGRKRR